MWNNILSIFLEPNLPESQHGFRPGRGTAWHELLTKVITAKNIYEFDLKKFFDRVSTAYITEKLLSLGVPKAIAYMFQDLHRSRPVLPTEHKIDETALLERANLEASIDTGQTIKDHAALREWKTFSAAIGNEVADKILLEDFSPEQVRRNKQQCILKYYELQWAILESTTGKPQPFFDYFEGSWVQWWEGKRSLPALYKPHVVIDTFNSSSVAAGSLLNILTRIRYKQEQGSKKKTEPEKIN